MKKLITAIIISTTLAGCHVKERKLHCITKTHDATSEGDRRIVYHTLLDCEDGIIYEVEGINFYIKKIDSPCI